MIYDNQHFKVRATRWKEITEEKMSHTISKVIRNKKIQKFKSKKKKYM